MTKVWKLSFALLGLVLLGGVWLWWNQVEPADMAAYVPADALIYLEAENLPEIIEKVVGSDAWRTVAPAAGVDAPRFGPGRLTTLAKLTGIGTHESVIFARAQVAVCVLGFNAAESPDATLKISPRGAVIFETHTGEWRVRAAVEKSVGSFARRTLGAAEPWRKEENGASFYTWVSPGDERRRLVAAVSGSVAVVGNDEAAVQACLAVRRGERPSLARDPQLGDMRARLGAGDALAFGFAPSGSAAKVFEAVAPLFVGQTSEDPRVQGMLAGALPKLAQRVLGAAGWSARFEGGAFVDRFYLSLPGALASRLSKLNVVESEPLGGAGTLLPAETYQVTYYNYGEPETAWLALNAGLSTQVDSMQAPGVTLALESLLEPYGVGSPREFLRAVGPSVVTARLAEASEGKLLVVKAKDSAALLEQARARLGQGATLKKMGNHEVWVSIEAERRAVALVGDYLLTGTEEDVAACLNAVDRGEALSSSERFKSSSAPLAGASPHVRTLTFDDEAVRTFFLTLARRRRRDLDMEAINAAVRRLPYALSETRVTEDGVEKVTRSALGQFGALFNRISAPGADAATAE